MAGSGGRGKGAGMVEGSGGWTKVAAVLDLGASAEAASAPVSSERVEGAGWPNRSKDPGAGGCAEGAVWLCSGSTRLARTVAIRGKGRIDFMESECGEGYLEKSV